jgi:hypothetical protein
LFQADKGVKMLFEKKHQANLRYPRAKSHSRNNYVYHWLEKSCLVRWALPIVGLASLVRFLFRVIPNPSRATYSCQRVAVQFAGRFQSRWENRC